MKAVRKEDFESEVDYIYSIVEVLKDFTEPQREALMQTAMIQRERERDAVAVYEDYTHYLHIYDSMYREVYADVFDRVKEMMSELHEEKPEPKERPDKLWRGYDAE